MKKVTCMLLAIMLCIVSAVAMMESTPSKTVDDFTKVDVTGENLPENSGFYIRLVEIDEVAYQHCLDICDNEIKVLGTADSVEAYFGNVEDFEGNAVDLKEMVGADILNVNEYKPIIAGDYNVEYGRVTATFHFATPYEVGEKVAVMIGLVSENADGTYSIDWTAYEGVGVEATEIENSGAIQVELNPEIIIAIQDGVALNAIVSD